MNQIPITSEAIRTSERIVGVFLKSRNFAVLRLLKPSWITILESGAGGSTLADAVKAVQLTASDRVRLREASSD